MKNLRQALLDILKALGLYDIVRWVYVRAAAAGWLAYSLITGRDRQMIGAYLAGKGHKKLHLGCGLNHLEGWLNTDLRPDVDRIYLNVTKHFPFPDNSFDYIFSEHVIEHMPYRAGEKMLRESFRVLKSGGVLRLVTPDINFLIGLYQDDQKKLHKDYINWSCAQFIQDKAPHCALSVFNNYVRDWGHLYIYDAPVLKAALKEYGFKNIKIKKLGESEHKALQKLEHAERHPPGFLALESMVIEAEKA